MLSRGVVQVVGKSANQEAKEGINYNGLKGLECLCRRYTDFVTSTCG